MNQYDNDIAAIRAGLSTLGPLAADVSIIKNVAAMFVRGRGAWATLKWLAQVIGAVSIIVSAAVAAAMFVLSLFSRAGVPWA